MTESGQVAISTVAYATRRQLIVMIMLSRVLDQGQGVAERPEFERTQHTKGTCNFSRLRIMLQWVRKRKAWSRKSVTTCSCRKTDAMSEACPVVN
eukprot:6615895-Prymnesium_polylepis.1